MREYALAAFAVVAAAMALPAAGEGPMVSETAPANAKPGAVEGATPQADAAAELTCPACGGRNPPAADFCIYCGANLEQRARKRVPQAVPAPPWFGPGGGYGSNRASAGVACSYNRPRFDIRGGAWYYLSPASRYNVYEYSVDAAFRLYILTWRQRPFVEIKPVYYYEKYYRYDPRRGVTGSDAELHPGVVIGMAYNYDRRGSSLAGAAGYTALLDLSGDYLGSRYPLVLENVTFINSWLGFWLRADIPIRYLSFPILYNLSGGAALAF